MNETPRIDLEIDDSQTALDNLTTQLSDMRARKDAAYLERNRVVAAYARLAIACGLTAGVGLHDLEADPTWEAEWRFILFIDLPTGQVSWHFHQDDLALFAWLPRYEKPWDGHTTPEKYNRLAAFTPSSLLGAKLHEAKAALDAVLVPLHEAMQQQLADIITTQVNQVAAMARATSQHASGLEQASNARINQLINVFTSQEIDRGLAVAAALAPLQLQANG